MSDCTLLVLQNGRVVARGLSQDSSGVWTSTQDAGAVYSYTIDWTGWLDGDTIVDGYTSTAGAVDVRDFGFGTAEATFLIASPRSSSSVRVTVSTAAGRTDSRVLNFSGGSTSAETEVTVLTVPVIPATEWAAETTYAVRDAVWVDAVRVYRARRDHVSGSDFSADFAAGKWALVADFSPLVDAIDAEKLDKDGDGSAVTVKGRTLDERAEDITVVMDYGAAPGNTAAANTTAVNLAIAAAPENGTLLFSGGNFALNTGDLVFGGKKLTFKLDGATINGSFPLGIPAIVDGAFQSGRRVYQANGATGADFALSYSYRNANYTGGTFGNVNAGILHVTDIGPGTNAFEWAVVGVVNALGGGDPGLNQPTGVYGQGNRKASTAGPVFGGVFEARDTSGQANPTVGIVGAEVDCFANGGDSNSRRYALDIVVGKGVDSGAKCEAAFGVHIGPSFGDSSLGRFKTAVGIDGDIDCGVDVSHASIASGGVAFRQAANQKFALTTLNDRTFSYTASGFEYQVSGSSVARFRDDGAVHVVGVSSGNVAYRQPNGTYLSFVTDDQRKIGYTSSGLQYRVGSTDVFTIKDNGIIYFQPFTIATLPSAAANGGWTTRVSNGTGGRALVTSDGTNWRYQDGTVAA